MSEREVLETLLGAEPCVQGMLASLRRLGFVIGIFLRGEQAERGK